MSDERVLGTVGPDYELVDNICPVCRYPVITTGDHTPERHRSVGIADDRDPFDYDEEPEDDDPFDYDEEPEDEPGPFYPFNTDQA